MPEPSGLAAAGFRPDGNQGSADRTLWRRDRALDIAAIERARLVSLDIFDTLLVREWGAPEAIFHRTANRAAAAGLLAARDAVDWFPAVRVAAERAAERSAEQAGNAHDVDLAAIYAALPPTVGDRAAIAEIEWAEELAAARPNPFLLSLLHDLRARGIPVALLSDMYLGAARIEQMLARAGIGQELYRHLLVSSDFGCRKSDGRLFDHLFGRFPDVPPADMLHIGDNPQSDHMAPRDRGLATILYQHDAAFCEIVSREGGLGTEAGGPLPTTRQLAAHLGEPGASPDLWFDTGLRVHGPVIDAFARWILQDCLARGIRRIAPFMREGHLFAAALERHAARLEEPIDVRPLYVSRQALFRAARETITREDFRKTAADTAYRTLDDALRAYAVTTLPPALEPYRHRYFVDLIGLADGGHEDVAEAVAAYVTAPECRAAFETLAAEERDRLRRYLRQELGGDAEVATVDLGGRGSAHRTLTRILGGASPWAMQHYLLYANPDFLEALLAGETIQVFMPLDRWGLDRGLILSRGIQSVEPALNGSLPTTLGHRDTADGRVEPVLGRVAGGAEQVERLRRLHAGIAAYLDFAATAWPFDRTVGAGPNGRRQAIDMLYRFIHLPTREEATQFGMLMFDLGEFLSATRSVVDDTALAAVEAVAAIGQPYLLKSAMLLRAPVVPWPQGALTQLHPDHITALYQGAAAGLGHELFARVLVAKLVAAGEREVLVAAAGGEGGMGPTFIRIAQAAGLTTVAYLDYFPERVGRVFHQLPVVDAPALTATPAAAAAVISTGFGAALARIVDTACRAGGIAPRIYRLNG